MPDPFHALLARLEGGAVALGDADRLRFPPAAWAALEAAGAVVPTTPAAEAGCEACDTDHTGEVFPLDTPGRPARWFVRCPEFGAVEFDPDRLRRWAVVPAALGRAVAGHELTERLPGRVWKLGPVRVGETDRIGWLVAGWRGETGLADRVPELAQPTAAAFVPDALPPAAVWGAASPPVVVALADVLTLTAAGLGVDPAALAAHLTPVAWPAGSDGSPHADSGKSGSTRPADEPVIVAASPPLVPLPPGTRWEDVAVEVDDHHLVVRGPAGEWRVGYEPAGFADARTGAPGQRWQLLRQLAKRGGELDDGDRVFTKSDRLTRGVSDLRAALRRLTGLADDPFRPTRRNQPYRTRFRLTLARPSDG